MQPDRSAELSALLQKRLLILDGAMGTMIQRHKLQEADYRGARFADHPFDLKGNNDLLLLTKPDVIRGIHSEYLAAGADILETCTFYATSLSQADYHLEAIVYELNVAGARPAQGLGKATGRAERQRGRFERHQGVPTNKKRLLAPLDE